MADAPRFPGDEDAERNPNRSPRWGLILGIIIVSALLGLVVFLHLNGTIGPGSH